MQIDLLGTTPENAKECEELFISLTERALNDNHNDWEFIRNPVEWGVARKTKAGLYKIIELYDCISKELYIEYCKQVKQSSHDFSMLVALKQYQQCVEFYKQELFTIADMLEEYKAYLWKGHFLTQFFYQQDREQWHLWDHRQDSINGN